MSAFNLATQHLGDSPDAKAKAKDYIASNHIPQLFEAITAGLLHHRPADPLQFVQDAIRTASANKTTVSWNSFVEWDPPMRPTTSDSRPETSESKVRFSLSEHHHDHHDNKDDKFDRDAASRASSGYRSLSRTSEEADT